eukprot:Hpha_TRINITY_DN10664_c0_g2::TRINITY_DN10664_c0_g2_i1::g.156744::m.156744/K05303/K05303; O-methyltransferase
MWGGVWMVAAVAVIPQIPLTSHEFQHDVQLCRIPGYCLFNASRGRRLQELYLYTLRNSLTGTLLATDSYLDTRLPFTKQAGNRLEGAFAIPVHGMTMTGMKRMEALHELLHRAYRDQKLTGDFLECGTWRGGSSIYAKGFLDAYMIDRRVFVADSFEGLPHSQEQGDMWSGLSIFKVSKDQVADHFARYQLLDDKVEFVQGWFSDSLPVLKKRLQGLAVVRLDGDMFGSTVSTLCNVYDNIQIGGYWIVDDYYSIKESRKAVDWFIAHHKAENEGPVAIDRFGAYFKKTKEVTTDSSWCAAALNFNMAKTKKRKTARVKR